MSVMFGDRMNKSYKVTLGRDVKYTNDREPHVESDQQVASGTTYKLGLRKQFKVKSSYAVTYDVVGVTNAGKPAHITVYFGPSVFEAAKY